ncbi:MAG: methionyl-tRNA formyltransferase [Actinomycetota bacterium]|jgi:methionyl-tRNA formyltransferase|nr:methionyl-tRNA formyltransferase [Actinomycetota bacterium]
MRLLFLGNDPWSVPALEALVGNPAFDVTGVITNPPRPAGRGSQLTPTTVASAARRLEIDVLEAEGVRGGGGFDAIETAAPDVLIVVAYGELLTPEVLAIPRIGAVNVHFSLLPRWRGASPVQHALLAGDDRTGVTLMQMDRGLDTGPILAAVIENVRPTDDAGSLGARLADIGAALLVEALPPYVAGAREPEAQSEDGVTFAPKLGPADRVIAWEQSPDDVVGRVRALSPHPGARTSYREEPLKILRAEATTSAPWAAPSEPGTVVSVDALGPIIAAGTGSVVLNLVAPSGRKHMTGAEWARGVRLQPGERLG